MRGLIGRLRSRLTLLAVLLGFASTAYTIAKWVYNRPGVDLNGRWDVSFTISDSDYRPFRGMRLDYAIVFQQNGPSVTGIGEKQRENGALLSGRARSPIQFQGMARWGDIHLQFEEQGQRRSTVGQCRLRYNASTGRLAGRFYHSAGNSRGHVLATAAGGDSTRYDP